MAVFEKGELDQLQKDAKVNNSTIREQKKDYRERADKYQKQILLGEYNWNKQVVDKPTKSRHFKQNLTAQSLEARRNLIIYERKNKDSGSKHQTSTALGGRSSQIPAYPVPQASQTVSKGSSKVPTLPIKGRT
jgi:hypothetical protein